MEGVVNLGTVLSKDKKKKKVIINFAKFIKRIISK